MTKIEVDLTAAEDLVGGALIPELVRGAATHHEALNPLTGAILHAVADAMPEPPVTWPTTPGSTARTDRWMGDAGEVRIAALDETGTWYVLGYDYSWPVEDLRAEGFVPVHDAGQAQSAPAPEPTEPVTFDALPTEPVGVKVRDEDGDVWKLLENGRWQLGHRPDHPGSIASHIEEMWAPFTLVKGDDQ